MTDEELLQMARRFGPERFPGLMPMLRAVRDRTREECAVVCDEHLESHCVRPCDFGKEDAEPVYWVYRKDCAAAIRGMNDE